MKNSSHHAYFQIFFILGPFYFVQKMGMAAKLVQSGLVPQNPTIKLAHCVGPWIKCFQNFQACKLSSIKDVRTKGEGVKKR